MDALYAMRKLLMFMSDTRNNEIAINGLDCVGRSTPQDNRHP